MDDSTYSPHRALTPRQEAVRALFDRLAPEVDRWADRNRAFHDADLAYLRFLIPARATVLEIGCGLGDVLAALEPSRGVGIDLAVLNGGALAAQHGTGVQPGVHLHQRDTGVGIARFDGAVALAVAAYNAGPARVVDWLNTNGDPRQPTTDVLDWIETIPFGETRNYVQRVVENQVIYRAKRDEIRPHPLAAQLR